MAGYEPELEQIVAGLRLAAAAPVVTNVRVIPSEWPRLGCSDVGASGRDADNSQP